MKRNLIIFALLFANYGISQVNSQPIEKKTTIIQSAVSSAEKKAFNDSIKKQLHQVDSHLNSIQFKWDYIQNDPDENQIAINSGWFDKMTAVKNRLTVKKQLLTDSLK